MKAAFESLPTKDVDNSTEVPLAPLFSTIIQGDARFVLKEMPSDFFQVCVTSPPYWGTRDYGMTGQIGAEQSLDDYVKSLETTFEEVRRRLTARWPSVA